MSEDALTLALIIVCSFFIIIIPLFLYIKNRDDPFDDFRDEFFLNSANPMLCYFYSPRLFKKYIKRRAEEVVCFCEEHGIDIEEFRNHLSKTGSLYETYDFFIEKIAEARHRRITP